MKKRITNGQNHNENGQKQSDMELLLSVYWFLRYAMALYKPNLAGFILNMTIPVLNLTNSILNMTISVLNITFYRLLTVKNEMS